VNIGKLERRVDVEFDRAIGTHFDVLGERLPPGGVLQLDSMTVVIPVLPAFHPINQVHILV
jgi:hypothetical protein